MEFTGERFIPEKGGIMAIEHMHRYVFASQFVSGKVVLDIASGEGYGSNLLARKASKVIGVDVSEEAVKHAQQNYQRDNLTYKVGDCAKIPLPDDSVDVLVSFETIEHHDKHDEMMREVHRVLKDDGLLVISSPDKYEHTDLTGHDNPWHIKELYKDEFVDLVTANFEHSHLLGQRVIYGSLLLSEVMNKQIISYDADDESLSPYKGLRRPLFWVLLASNKTIPEMEHGAFEQDLKNSDFQIYIDSLKESFERAETYAKSLEAEINKVKPQFESEVAQLQQQLSEHNTEVAELKAVINRSEQNVQGLHEEKAQLLAQQKQLIGEMQAVLDEKNNEIVELTAQLHELKLLSNESRVQKEAYENRVITLEEELTIARNNADDYKQQAADVQSSLLKQLEFAEQQRLSVETWMRHKEQEVLDLTKRMQVSEQELSHYKQQRDAEFQELNDLLKQKEASFNLAISENESKFLLWQEERDKDQKALQKSLDNLIQEQRHLKISSDKTLKQAEDKLEACQLQKEKELQSAIALLKEAEAKREQYRDECETRFRASIEQISEELLQFQNKTDSHLQQITSKSDESLNNGLSLKNELLTLEQLSGGISEQISKRFSEMADKWQSLQQHLDYLAAHRAELQDKLHEQQQKIDSLTELSERQNSTMFEQVLRRESLVEENARLNYENNQLKKQIANMNVDTDRNTKRKLFN